VTPLGTCHEGDGEGKQHHDQHEHTGKHGRPHRAAVGRFRVLHVHDKGDWVGDDQAVVRHEVHLSNRDVFVVSFNVEFHNKIYSQKRIRCFNVRVCTSFYVIDMYTHT